jgi:adenine-specific DNA-methyltransferase
MDLKNKLGQYFTTNVTLKEKVFTFIQNKPKLILEPSIGRGDLISFILNKKLNIKFDMFEIDKTITFLDNINESKIIFTDFLSYNITKSYTTIIGNPPFVRTKSGNMYIDFTEKCYNLLTDNGELIFIVPSDFFKLTSASALLNNMMNNGSFTHIYHPNNEKLFEDANIDIIIFRYCKNKSLPKTVIHNDKLMHISNNNGLITFSDTVNNSLVVFSDFFDIYVGIVSGLDKVYKHDILGTISVLNGQNKIEKFIFIDNFPSSNPDIDSHMLKHKSELISRKIKKFNESNWFEWGAPRNIKTINSNLGKECIFVNNLTRNSTVAWSDKVQLFGGGLLIMIPKQKCNINNIVKYINSDEFKKNFIFSGRFKIGHRQLSNSSIPNNIIN